MGRSDQRAVTSRLTTLLVHLLDWRYEREPRTEGWSDTIARERIELPLIFEQSPSLARFAEATFAKAYRLARREAARQTRLSLGTFPMEFAVFLARGAGSGSLARRRRRSLTTIGVSRRQLVPSDRAAAPFASADWKQCHA